MPAAECPAESSLPLKGGRSLVTSRLPPVALGAVALESCRAVSLTSQEGRGEPWRRASQCCRTVAAAGPAGMGPMVQVVTFCVPAHALVAKASRKGTWGLRLPSLQLLPSSTPARGLLPIYF